MRVGRALCVAAALRRTIAIGAGGAVVLASVAPALAQSAADKATARQLATEGIKLYRAGKYADALDKLQRAEALYDAPVHLLYIARSQVQLGKLVEGAETYRKLARVQLEAGAPPAFKEAQDAGGPELQKLEPRIPALKLDVQPADARDLQISIDGESVPSAVLGVDRPANPGSHTIKVSATGYEPVEKTVTLAESEKKPVEIKLAASAGGATPVPVAAPAAGPAPAPTGSAPPPSNEPPPSKASIGFMLGLRLGAAIPGGSVATDVANNDIPVSDYAKAGGGAELHGGIRFAKYFTPVLFLSGQAFKSGPHYDNLAAGVPGVTATTTITGASGGIGLIVGTPRNQLGGFGEIDYLPYESFTASTDISAGGLSCTTTDTLSGSAFRVGGGAVIPVAGWLNLTPFVTAQFGSFGHEKFDTSSCSRLSPAFTSSDLDIPSGQRKAHSLVFIGLGGDWVFGNDK